MEKQAEEDIKEEERQKRRRKEEEDYLEGYGEDHQEEDEVEEDEGTDKKRIERQNRAYDNALGRRGERTFRQSDRT